MRNIKVHAEPSAFHLSTSTCFERWHSLCRVYCKIVDSRLSSSEGGKGGKEGGSRTLKTGEWWTNMAQHCYIWCQIGHTKAVFTAHRSQRRRREQYHFHVTLLDRFQLHIYSSHQILPREGYNSRRWSKRLRTIVFWKAIYNLYCLFSKVTLLSLYSALSKAVGIKLNFLYRLPFLISVNRLLGSTFFLPDIQAGAPKTSPCRAQGPREKEIGR